MSASPALPVLPALALPTSAIPACARAALASPALGTDRTLPRRSGEALARFPGHPV